MSVKRKTNALYKETEGNALESTDKCESLHKTRIASAWVRRPLTVKIIQT